MESASTFSFHREIIDEDDSSLYTSVRFANGMVKTMDNKRLHPLVVDCIRRNQSIHSEVPGYDINCKPDAEANSKAVKVYCDVIKKGKLQYEELLIRVLAMVCRLVIYVISIVKPQQNNININVRKYCEDVNSFKECICIVYDEEKKHYDALCMVKNAYGQKEIKPFERDGATFKLFCKFILEEYNYDVNMQKSLNYNQNISTEPSTKENSYKRIKFDKSDSFESSSSNKNNGESSTSDKCSQVNVFTNKAILSNEDESKRNLQTVSDNVHGVETMQFETELAEKFRGRYSSDFEPKKTKKPNEKPSEPGAPRYFADRNNRNYLSLLIPNAYLLAAVLGIRLEICIVTQEIDGYTYYHPYFKFQDHPMGSEYPNGNPIYIVLDSSLLSIISDQRQKSGERRKKRTIELKEYSQAFKQLILPLVVAMLKNNELMQCDQPLKIFSFRNTGDHGEPIIKTFDCHETFKSTYHLHDLRFAITPWIKQSDEEGFKRHVDKQYISQISTEDQSYTIVGNNA
ncbi:unnamed protein product [Rotaria sp. Silwood2]|nr:unnamed protein product [Rotaria sp. Silwood2]